MVVRDGVLRGVGEGKGVVCMLMKRETRHVYAHLRSRTEWRLGRICETQTAMGPPIAAVRWHIHY